MPTVMVMNREVRHVPMDWHHPKDERGYWEPLLRGQMPKGDAIRMYETTSEGTPVSAPYPDTDDGRRAMAHECSHRGGGITDGMTAEDWLRIIDGTPLGRDVRTGGVV